MGVFVLQGPDIKQDTLVHGLSLLDITPTLLTLFGLPVGDDMDGQPILDAFVDPAVAGSPFPVGMLIEWRRRHPSGR